MSEDRNDQNRELTRWCYGGYGKDSGFYSE